MATNDITSKLTFADIAMELEEYSEDEVPEEQSEESEIEPEHWEYIEDILKLGVYKNAPDKFTHFLRRFNKGRLYKEYPTNWTEDKKERELNHTKDWLGDFYRLELLALEGGKYRLKEEQITYRMLFDMCEKERLSIEKELEFDVYDLFEQDNKSSIYIEANDKMIKALGEDRKSIWKNYIDLIALRCMKKLRSRFPEKKGYPALHKENITHRFVSHHANVFLVWFKEIARFPLKTQVRKFMHLVNSQQNDYHIDPGSLLYAQIMFLPILGIRVLHSGNQKLPPVNPLNKKTYAACGNGEREGKIAQIVVNACLDKILFEDKKAYFVDLSESTISTRYYVFSAKLNGQLVVFGIDRFALKDKHISNNCSYSLNAKHLMQEIIAYSNIALEKHHYISINQNNQAEKRTVTKENNPFDNMDNMDNKTSVMKQIIQLNKYSNVRNNTNIQEMIEEISGIQNEVPFSHST